MDNEPSWTDQWMQHENRLKEIWWHLIRFPFLFETPLWIILDPGFKPICAPKNRGDFRWKDLELELAQMKDAYATFPTELGNRSIINLTGFFSCLAWFVPGVWMLPHWKSLRMSLWFDVMMEQKTPSFESHDWLLGSFILHRFETQHHVETQQLQIQMEEAGPWRDIWKPNWSPWTLNENIDQYISLYFILDLHCLRHVRHSFRWGSGPKKQRKKGK